MISLVLSFIACIKIIYTGKSGVKDGMFFIPAILCEVILECLILSLLE